MHYRELIVIMILRPHFSLPFALFLSLSLCNPLTVSYVDRRLSNAGSDGEQQRCALRPLGLLRECVLELAEKRGKIGAVGRLCRSAWVVVAGLFAFVSFVLVPLNILYSLCRVTYLGWVLPVDVEAVEVVLSKKGDAVVDKGRTACWR